MNPVVLLLLLVGLVVPLRSRAAQSAGDTPVLLSRAHLDLRITYEPGGTNELSMVVNDEAQATRYRPGDVVLVVRSSAETVIPEGFEEFGSPGSPLWILPASPDPELLFLGFSAEGLPQGVFDEPFAIRLVSVEAPGSFFVWRFGAEGNLDMSMNSRDGIGPQDVVHTVPGSHGDYNWGFSSNGWYSVTFQVEGRLRGASTNLTAGLNTFRFAVEPLPASAASLSRIAVAADQLTADLAGTPGARYQLQTSDNLTTWIDGATITAAEESVPVSVAIPTGQGTLFLRAVLE